MDEAKPGPEVRDGRQKVVDALCEHFANDVLEVEEFERRVDLAHQARSLEELGRILEDLPDAGVSVVAAGDEERSPARAPGSRTPMVPEERVRDRDLVIGILGGSVRKGRWIPARWTVAVGIMGGAELDFREAALGPGVTDVTVLAFMGGVEIIVPPGMDVECRGLGILGGFEQTSHQPLDHDSERPLLRIRGVACMGGVEVDVRHPGESSRDARRRRRLERKEQRRLSRGE